jgi:predicted CoA-binding protein
MDDINTLRRILRECRTLAVVGLSAEWHRPSYFAAKYMQEHGYRVIPVNPKYREILGERCYASLQRIGNSFASVPRNARGCGVFRVGERCFSP